MEKLYLDSQFYRLFNKLINIVSLNPGIEINEVVIELLSEYFDEDVINESIDYFISKEYFYKFENIKLRANKIPKICLIEDKIPEYPKLVISLPPFNEFGFKKNLELSNVSFFSIKDEINRLFENSEKSIYICSPFLQLDGIRCFLPLLCNKAKKGVEIKIISRQIAENDFQSRYGEIKEINNFFKKNNSTVQIKNYHYHSKNYVKSSTHAKFIVCDDKMAYVGSGELRKNSFEKNFELGVIVKGEKAKQLGIIFNKLFSISKKVDFV